MTNEYTVRVRYEGPTEAGLSHNREVTVTVKADTSMLAAEAAERLVHKQRGGHLDKWFAHKVEPRLGH